MRLNRRQRKHLESAALFSAAGAMWHATGQAFNDAGFPNVARTCLHNAQANVACASEQIALSMIPSRWQRMLRWLFT